VVFKRVDSEISRASKRNRTSSPHDSVMSLSRASSTASVASSKRWKENSIKISIPDSSSSEEEEEEPRGRGRPCVIPEHKGQFTAKALKERRHRERDERNRRLAKLVIADPLSGLEENKRLLRSERETVELVEEYRNLPSTDVAAMLHEGTTAVKVVVQKSRNIRGDFVKELWQAVNKIQAACTILHSRAPEGHQAASQEGVPSSASAAEEIACLRVDNLRLEKEISSLKQKIEEMAKAFPPPPPPLPPRTRSGRLWGEGRRSHHLLPL
jgi:hypothetical protein